MQVLPHLCSEVMFNLVFQNLALLSVSIDAIRTISEVPPLPAGHNAIIGQARLGGDAPKSKGQAKGKAKGKGEAKSKAQDKPKAKPVIQKKKETQVSGLGLLMSRLT